MQDIRIDSDMIRLGQLLKLADFADNGAEAKFLIENEHVFVNGTVETRRGKQVRHGDVVSVDGRQVRLITAGQ